MSLRVALITWVLVSATLAAEPAVDATDLPRVPPTEPRGALKTFRIKQGFRIELAAAEPLVVDPIAMCFDENGRLFVTEMRDYSERRDERLGRIKLLEDADNDGNFEKATVFAEGLPWPTALFCYGGGLFVGSTPDILFFKDTNDDGVADERNVVFTGFGSSVQRLNVQALLNSFAWGLDNRVYGLTSMNGGVITSPLDSEMKPLDLRGRNFSFDPRIIERIGKESPSPAGPFVRPESGGGQHGMSFDDFGRWFVCSNSAHLQMLMYDARDASRNPHYAMPGPLVDIAVDGPAAEVFRISPDEPWRVIRTKWRVAGLVPGPIEGGGRASGYFTGATGVTIYRGNAFPADFLGNAFVGDAGGNLVHRKVIHLEDSGRSLVQPIARRPTDEQRVEFLASTDNWFRPVQFANAPDGCLYIADMYREVIEHPWSLPESIKKHLDLNSGNDRGRIYRIVPEKFDQPTRPNLRDADNATLVATLEHANGWHRDTAARLLYERQDKGVAGALRQLMETSKAAVGRLHAMYALAALGVLDEATLTRAVRDADASVRENAVRLSARVSHDGAGPYPFDKKTLAALARDNSARVRYQLALTLGRLPADESIGVHAELIRDGASDRWIQAAILDSLSADDGVATHALIDAVLSDPAWRRRDDRRDFVRSLFRTMIGYKRRGQVLKDLARLNDPPLQLSLAREAFEGLRRDGAADVFHEEYAELRARAFKLLEDRERPEPDRIAAIEFLSLTSFHEFAPTLLSLLSINESEPVRRAVLAWLDRYNEPDVAAEILTRWASFTPRVRAEALGVLLRRPDRALALLKAIQINKLRPSELSSNQHKFLREHADPTVRVLAANVLTTRNTTRQQVVEAYSPALELKGNAARGRDVFRERCVSCHRLGDEGHALGPDLVTVRNAGKEKMLLNILDPNREVPPNYLAYLVETKDGESHLGLIASETAAAVTLRQAYGLEVVVPRARLKRMKSQEQSLMPEGLEDGLTPQTLADLLEFLESGQ